jgi:hypothetical protein
MSVKLVTVIDDNGDETLHPVCRYADWCGREISRRFVSIAETVGMVFRESDATACEACGASL